MLTPHRAFRASPPAAPRAFPGRPAVSLLLALLVGVTSTVASDVDRFSDETLRFPPAPNSLEEALLEKGYLSVKLFIPNPAAKTPAETTTLLNEAIRVARDQRLVLYFPAGATYVINNTLKAYTSTKNTPIERGGDRHRIVVMVGGTNGARPKIKLADTSSGFETASDTGAKPVVWFRPYDPTEPVKHADDPKPPLKVYTDYPDDGHDSKVDPNSAYYQMIRGIDIDCGNNPGAIGLIFNQAQDASIEDVKVYGFDFYIGISGLPGRGAGAVNIEVVGGQIGLDTKYPTGSANFVSTIAGLKLINQKTAPLRHEGLPLTIVGFEIDVSGVATNISAITTFQDDARPYYLRGPLALIDGKISVGSGYPSTMPVIDNSAAPNSTDARNVRNIYVRNVYVDAGATTSNVTLVKSGTATAVTSNNSSRVRVIQEYGYCDQRDPDDLAGLYAASYNLLGGTVGNGGSQGGGQTYTIATIASAAVPGDLITRHIWGRLPSVDDGDYHDFVAANNITFTDGVATVSAGLLNGAIEDYPKIFLRKGIYKINGPVTLKKDTVLFGVARHMTLLETNWLPTVETAFITTESHADAITYLGDVSIGVKADEEQYDWFTALEWKAGRNSMVHMGRPYHNPKATGNFKPTNPHTLVKITGKGGGRWYFLGRGENTSMQDDGYRMLKVDKSSATLDDPSVPLWIYGLNLEHASASSSAGVIFGEFNKAQNVRIYGLKTEYDSTGGTHKQRYDFLSFKDGINIGVFNYGGTREPPKDGFSLVDIQGGSNLLVANVLPDEEVPETTGNIIKDGSAVLVWHGADVPANGSDTDYKALALYKRGTIDDALLKHLPVGYGKLPVTPAGWWWKHTNIGTMSDKGSAFYATNGEAFTVNGSGADIFGGGDEFSFVHSEIKVSGNKTIVARVRGLDNTDINAKAGVMIRAEINDNNGGDRFAHAFVTPGNGVKFHYRMVKDGTVTNVGSGNTYTAPYWVKLVRSGSTVTASMKSDTDTTWTTIGSITFSPALETSVYYGLTTCSKVDGTINTAVFDNVSVN